MLYKFLNNTLKIVYMKYEHISPSSYRVSMFSLFKRNSKKVQIWSFCGLSCKVN